MPTPRTVTETLSNTLSFYNPINMNQVFCASKVCLSVFIASTDKLAFIQEYGRQQSIIQSDGICCYCFGPIDFDATS